MRQNAKHFLASAGLLSLTLLLPHPAAAAWPTDPLVNVPLCTAAPDQSFPVSVSDGAGGSIVAWRDFRNGNWDIYAQRISAAGAVQWTTDGVAICTATGNQLTTTIASDGSGGAIVTWDDIRSGTTYDIYAQRVSADGAVQWTANGVAISTAASHQQVPTLVADGAGGAIVTWFDLRSGNYDIYAQRISAGGAPQWTADGVAICTAIGFQEYPTIISDGANGAIITWFDQRTGVSYTSSDIYAQRVSAAGTTLWTADGVALCTATGADQYPTITSDGAGGAIVTWFDARSGGYHIYAQRVSSGGVVQWLADGVALCTASGAQYYPTIDTDGAGGAIVTWNDTRNGSDYDVYAQRISAGGTPQWTADGVPICATGGDQYGNVLVPDGAGGAIVTWTDMRSGVAFDIYAQRISAAGASEWAANGVALCTAPYQQNVPTIVPDGAAGAIVTWQDQRGGGGQLGANHDIYAQRVKGNGQLGGDVVSVPASIPLAFALDPVRPNPAHSSALMVHFALPSAAAASLELLDVAGRRLASRDVGTLGAGSHALDLAGGRHLAPGLYLVSLRQGANVRSARVVVLE